MVDYSKHGTIELSNDSDNTDNSCNTNMASILDQEGSDEPQSLFLCTIMVEKQRSQLYQRKYILGHNFARGHTRNDDREDAEVSNLAGAGVD